MRRARVCHRRKYRPGVPGLSYPADLFGDEVPRPDNLLSVLAGVVCDGLVRDIDSMPHVGLPVFSRGVSPNSGFKHGPGEINTRFARDGIVVYPADVIAGDREDRLNI